MHINHVSDALRERFRYEFAARWDEAPWAYDYLDQQLNTPTPFDADKYDALAVFSHDWRSEPSTLTPECTARIRRAVGVLRSSAATSSIRQPELVLLCTTECRASMRRAALECGFPPAATTLLGHVPLSQAHTGTQCQDLAAYGVARGWRGVYLYTTYAHALRLHYTANQWFTGPAAAIERAVGYGLWPEEPVLLTREGMAEQMTLIEKEIRKTKRYCAL